MRTEFSQSGSQDYKVLVDPIDIYNLTSGVPLMSQFEIIKNGKAELHDLLICACTAQEINKSRKLLRLGKVGFGNGPHAIITWLEKIHHVHIDIEFIQGLESLEEDNFGFLEILLDEIKGTKLILRKDKI